MHNTPRIVADTKLLLLKVKINKLKLNSVKYNIINVVGSDNNAATEIEQQANSNEDLFFKILTQLAENAYMIEAIIITNE